MTGVSQINIDNIAFALNTQLKCTRTLTVTGVYSPITNLE